VAQFLEAVGDFTTKDGRPTSFKNGIPGEKYWKGFKKRNPSVKRLNTKLLPRNRAAVSETELTS
jgi:hypothetical protein